MRHSATQRIAKRMAQKVAQPHMLSLHSSNSFVCFNSQEKLPPCMCNTNDHAHEQSNLHACARKCYLAPFVLGGAGGVITAVHIRCQSGQASGVRGTRALDV